MSLEECYEVCGGDLAAVRARLLDDGRIVKYLGFFLQDDTYELLGTSMAQQDWQTAFRAAHTLKGTSMVPWSWGFFRCIAPHLRFAKRSGLTTRAIRRIWLLPMGSSSKWMMRM